MESQNHVHQSPIEDTEHDELLEEVVVQMRIWLSKIYPTGKIDAALVIEKGNATKRGTVRRPENEFRVRARIWTFNNQYSIVANKFWCPDQDVPLRKYSNPDPRPELDTKAVRSDVYLGAMALSRKSRTGETWSRGNDLADGSFCEATWLRIVQDILRYEAEEVKSDQWKESCL